MPYMIAVSLEMSDEPDIFEQSIILTKDVDLDSDKYIDLRNQSNVSRIYNLESEIYSGDVNRGQHEVSTKIVVLK